MHGGSLLGIEYATTPATLVWRLAKFTGQTAVHGVKSAYHTYGSGGAFDNYKEERRQRLIQTVDDRIFECSWRTCDSALSKMDEDERAVTVRMDDAEAFMLPGLRMLRAHIDKRHNPNADIDLSAMQRITRAQQDEILDGIPSEKPELTEQ